MRQLATNHWRKITQLTVVVAIVSWICYVFFGKGPLARDGDKVPATSVWITVGAMLVLTFIMIPRRVRSPLLDTNTEERLRD